MRRATRLAAASSRGLRRGYSTAPSTFDAVIVGAGVIGNSIAVELSRAGWRTLNVDKQPAAGSGSTAYSSGICRMMYSIEDSVKFAYEGYTYYDDWRGHIGVPDERGYAELRRCGALVLRSEASASFLANVLRCYDAVGLEYEEWDAQQVQDRLSFDMASFAPPRRIDHELFGEPNGAQLGGGVFFPKGGYVSDPQLAAHNLQTAALATGRASFAFQQTVTEITRAGGRVSGVRLADGSAVHAPVVINAAGPHSSGVTRLAFPDPAENDMRISTRAMRQEVAYVAPPPSVDWGEGGEGVVCTDLDTGVYFRPEVGGKILVGTVEPACDALAHEYLADPEDAYPGAPSSALSEQWTNQAERTSARLVYRAALRMPTLPIPAAASTQGVVACYDVTEDWTPIYDGSSLPGFYMAIGTSGNQFKNAGVAGRLMRELIEAAEGGGALERFELQRIPGTHHIDPATFSRRREVLATSGSVMG